MYFGTAFEDVNMRLVTLLAALTLAACANAPMVQMSPDTYLISRADRAGIFGNAAAMKANVIQEATNFATSQGKVAIPISVNTTPVYPGHLATIDYQFKLVDPDSPEAVSTSLEPRADIVIESDERVHEDVRISDETDNTKDVYAEILKLEDLRQRGLITDDEFETEKRELLDNN